MRSRRGPRSPRASRGSRPSCPSSGPTCSCAWARPPRRRCSAGASASRGSAARRSSRTSRRTSSRRSTRRRSCARKTRTGCASAPCSSRTCESSPRCFPLRSDVHDLRMHHLRTALLYGTSATRVLRRARFKPSFRTDERLIFVVGSPRSGTTFLAGTLGRQVGLVDLGEVTPFKASVAQLATLPEDVAAQQLRRTLELVRRLALAGHLRGVEQTPETAFVLRAALVAYPQARAAHLGLDPAPLTASLARAFASSVGRWRRDLDAQQVADVEAEAGPLLAELGYGKAGGV